MKITSKGQVTIPIAIRTVFTIAAIISAIIIRWLTGVSIIGHATRCMFVGAIARAAVTAMCAQK